MIELFNDKALPSKPELTQSLLDQIDEFFERGNCFEIGGISRYSEPWSNVQLPNSKKQSIH